MTDTPRSDPDDTANSGDTVPTEPVHRYPAKWEADVLASDGGVVHLRPIAPDDAERLVRFHSSLSERTRYLRYFGPYPRMPERDVKHFTNVDHKYRESFVLLLGNDIVGVGLYERIKYGGDGTSAEVAFVIADEHQGRGFGSILLEYLAAAAAQNGFTRFEAEVLSENRGMISVFRDAGYEVSRSYDGSVAHLEFNIDPTEAHLTVRDSRERMSEARSVGNVLTPKSIAVIGASSDMKKVGGVILHNLLTAGFSGPVYPVNPERTSVHGVRAYPTVRDIPDEVDLAVAAVPAGVIDEVLDDCLAKRVKALVVVSAGFSEVGRDGISAERRLVQSARAHGMRLVGPNALGVVNTNPDVRLNASLVPVLPPRGRIGFFCQSGALGIAILDTARRRQLGLSTFVSAGNRADVSGNDLLQYWDTDPDTDVVLLYLESFGNPRKFSRIARRVARTKPIVAVKSGRHAAPFALEATGVSLDEASVAALFEQTGVVQVNSISDLFDCALLFGYQPLPTGPRVAVVGNSTALGVLTIDAARGEGLHATEPIDVGPHAEPAEVASAIASALASEDVDAVIVVFVPPVALPTAPYAEALREASRGASKPIITTFLGTEGIPDELAIRDETGAPVRGSIPSYPGPERAVAALSRAWRYARWRNAPQSKVIRPEGIDTDKARALIDPLSRDNSGAWLSDDQVRTLFSCYGLNIVDYKDVDTADEAAEAARQLEYPVVVKALGQRWQYRTDLLGVRLDLTREESVRVAYSEITRIAGESRVRVQKMAPKGIGCTLGLQDDPSFGTLLTFGIAGVISELVGDRAYQVPPLTEDAAHALIHSPKAAPLLDGYRGTEPVDKDALIDVIRRLSVMSVELPNIRELSIHPVLASPEGAAILGAQIRVGPENMVPFDNSVGPRRLR
ncbi:bifunctional acetate--CoA ligase family protein/GNAT family N-acetyltransferase [Hoyosella rhizosphaerae]|uniref:GNAT family N-acetyltransferase n=1 Tax=Hoyosella rhizosphaerae TaxID=1755582 RepID=A0A916U5V3_9ACTN|nr:GNAT family N-acetyltransferase [Hoyosella rhizosphaerae]